MNALKNYAIFPTDDFSFYVSPDDRYKIQKHTPSEKEAELALFILADYIANNPQKFINYLEPVTDIKLEKYKIQLSGYFNHKNELIIQADCMCETALKPNENWRNNKFLGFEGGGNAFFWTQINLNQMIVTKLWANGVS